MKNMRIGASDIIYFTAYNKCLVVILRLADGHDSIVFFLNEFSDILIWYQYFLCILLGTVLNKLHLSSKILRIHYDGHKMVIDEVTYTVH